MYLKITNGTTTRGRNDFYKWEFDTTKIIIETLRGTKVAYSPQLGQTIELIEMGVAITTLEAKTLKQMTPELLYVKYKIETGKNATYKKKDQVIEYAKYTQWLAKLQKGREY